MTTAAVLAGLLSTTARRGANIGASPSVAFALSSNRHGIINKSPSNGVPCDCAAVLLREYSSKVDASIKVNGVNPTIAKIKSAFPGAITNASLVAQIQSSLLQRQGITTAKTLLATSLCCDEVSRQLEDDLRSVYGAHFSMGGLAGFPFGGITSFGAMAHHIPKEGSCVIVYGPHVGVNADGIVGTVNRRGLPHDMSGPCCGSAVEAAGFVRKVMENEIGAPSPSGAAAVEFLDAQQHSVRSALIPHGKRLQNASDPMVELPLALFDAQNDIMKQIVNAGCGEVHQNGKIALLGGIQINTPVGTSDYFLPKVFEVMDNKGTTLEDMLASLSLS